MDNMKIEAMEKEEQIKDIFKALVSDELYEDWGDSFSIEDADKKRVKILYRGASDLKEFKNKCKEPLLNAVRLLMGDKKKIKIKGNKKSSDMSPKAKKNIRALKFFVLGMFFVCFAAAIIVVLCNYIGNRNFRETFYNVSSIKVDSQMRVIQLSDLHSCSFGKENEKLITRIKELAPDIIICSGDMVDSTEDVDYAIKLARELSSIAPSYYIYGNNETESIYDFSLTQKELDEKFGFKNGIREATKLLELEDSFEEKLENAGIKVLKNEKDTIKVKSMDVDIYGVLTSNPSSFWSYSEKPFLEYVYENSDNIKITAIHEPTIFEVFQLDFWGDLIVCGHTHGGVIRVPILGPLYTHEGGLFPERSGNFVYGRYDVSGKPIIVSGGLENSNVLRINNEPELVIIDINKF